MTAQEQFHAALERMANELPAPEILNLVAGAFISLVGTMITADPQADPEGEVKIVGNIRDITLHPVKSDAPRGEVH